MILHFTFTDINIFTCIVYDSHMLCSIYDTHTYICSVCATVGTISIKTMQCENAHEYHVWAEMLSLLHSITCAHVLVCTAHGLVRMSMPPTIIHNIKGGQAKRTPCAHNRCVQSLSLCSVALIRYPSHRDVVLKSTTIIAAILNNTSICTRCAQQATTKLFSLLGLP